MNVEPHWQGWEPILKKKMFDSDSDTACFFYVR